MAKGTNFTHDFHSIAGSKESFEEPKDLTGQIRDALRMDKKSAENTTSDRESKSEATPNTSKSTKSNNTEAETKDEETEKVQKCDKV